MPKFRRFKQKANFNKIIDEKEIGGLSGIDAFDGNDAGNMLDRTYHFVEMLFIEDLDRYLYQTLIVA